MTTFVAALIVFLLAFAALAVGLFFRRPPLRRNCGHVVECRCASEGRERSDYCVESPESSGDRCRK